MCHSCSLIFSNLVYSLRKMKEKKRKKKTVDTLQTYSGVLRIKYRTNEKQSERIGGTFKEK